MLRWTLSCIIVVFVSWKMRYSDMTWHISESNPIRTCSIVRFWFYFPFSWSRIIVDIFSFEIFTKNMSAICTSIHRCTISTHKQIEFRGNTKSNWEKKWFSAFASNEIAEERKKSNYVFNTECHIESNYIFFISLVRFGRTSQRTAIWFVLYWPIGSGQYEM